MIGDDVQRRVCNVASRKTKIRALVKVAYRRVDPGAMIDGRREEVFYARIDNTRYPVQVQSEKIRVRAAAERRDGGPRIPGQIEVLEVRQAVEKPEKLPVAHVRPAEIEPLRLAPDDSNQVGLPDLLPRQVDRVPQSSVVAPTVQRLGDAHATGEVGRGQAPQDSNPEVAVERVHRPVLQRNDLRRRRNGSWSHDVLVYGNFWNGRRERNWMRKIISTSVCVWVGGPHSNSGL